MADFIITSVKYYVFKKTNGKVAMDGYKGSKPEPKAKAKATTEENGNDDPFGRNQKELQDPNDPKWSKHVQPVSKKV